MFDRDNWLEVLQIIIRNPVRAVLAGLGVSWGIFMLIIMVGAGNGLENGVKADMGNRDYNSMFMWTMRTTKAYKGYQPGRNLRLTVSDIDYLRDNMPDLEVVTPRNQLGGWRGSNNIARNNKTGAFNVYGDHPEYIRIDPIKIVQGRFLNRGDLEAERRVCIIGKSVKKQLFDAGETVLGEYIYVNSIAFKVIGVYGSPKQGEDAEEDEESIFVPFSTFNRAFRMGDRVMWFSALGKTGKPMAEIYEGVQDLLKQRLNVHPDDKRAIGGYNVAEEVDETNEIFDAIEIVGITLGMLVLIAGIIGVINIMLITIKERTKEFGIRRALGARPRSVILQVVAETVFLTTVAGCMGMMIGIGTLELLNVVLDEGTGSFRNPEISFRIVAIAMIAMIFSGALAGLLPAVIAVRVKPVDAIRTES